ncbi:MAG: Regulatory protein BlaR1 [Firmicutes bacterium ADurb.Bin248]|nr:MAG: Regulatory protein BlaR1 [Firmicutes bacterium ADurb.Bin248]HOG01828.1 M56 family metallopeptidase [Clostridia bacterium]
MEALFLRLLNMSLAASFVALAVMLLRMLLKRAPKWISFSLWAAVLFRLVCPVSFASVLSLFGRVGRLAPNGAPEYIPADIISYPNPLAGPAANAAAVSATPAAQAAASSGLDTARLLLTIGVCLWLAGIAAVLLYSVVSCWKLGRKLSDATRAGGNVYETDAIQTPFVFGILHPRVYLPVGLPEPQRRYVLLHENVHIRRGDYIIKPVALLALALHWFNPVVWLAFRLMNLDLEMSCDERVIRDFTREQTADYGEALLRLRARRPVLAGSPLAFNENSTEGRIRNVLNYKKPAFWAVLLAVAAAAVACVCLVSNPKKTQGEALVTPAQTLGQTPTSTAGQSVSPAVAIRKPADGVSPSPIRTALSPHEKNPLDLGYLGFQDDRSAYYISYWSHSRSYEETSVLNLSEKQRAEFIAEFNGRFLESIASIDAYLAANAPEFREKVEAQRPVRVVIDDMGYRREAPEKEVVLYPGEFYWHADELYVFSLINPAKFHWQHYGLAWYLIGVCDPHSESLYMLQGRDAALLGPYADTFFAHGGSTTDMDGEDFRILLDSAAYECLSQGMGWGSFYESFPLSEMDYFNQMNDEGDDMSVTMAASFTAWLADEYGFDRVVSYCDGRTDFEGAYGAPFAELYAGWSAHILKTYGD